MRLSVFLFILFGLSLSGYLIGYQPMAFEVFAQNVGTSESVAQSIINGIFSIFTNPAFLLAIGITAVAGFLLGGSGFSVVFIVPLFMLMIIANMFILPTSFFFDATLDPLTKNIIGIMINLFLVLTIIGFVRGGEI